MKKRIILSICSVLGASVLVVGGALALFTARTDSDFYAKAGTVRIDLDGLELTNPENINPGDSDPGNPDGAVGGTEHVFTYDVFNNGNKSVRTRHSIILSCDAAGDSTETLDARYFEMFEDGEELVEKLYILKDDSTKKEVGKDDFVKAVKYTFFGDVMDGKGKSIADGGDAEKEDVSGTVKQDGDKVSKTYSYNLAMLRQAPNSYQGCDVNIEVVVEGMQYRNTNNDDWSVVGVVSKTFSTADVKINVVPQYDEDKNGNIVEAIKNEED